MKKTYLLILFSVPFLTSCGPAFLKKMLKDNPEIIIESIKSNPEKYMEALADAQRQFMVNKRKQQKEQEQANREAEYQNPKKPDTPDSRVYFGDKKAPITIVEYSDFQCGYCARVVSTVKQVLKKYPKQVRVLYKHKPLFPGSSRASEYYEAIGMQSNEKAYKFHDKLFEKKGQIRSGGDKFLNDLAEQLDVDMGKLKKDLDKAKSIVSADAQEAEKFGFSGTPGFLVGGVTVPGAVPYSHFEEIIKRHLSKGKGGGEAEAKKADKEGEKK